MAGNPNFNDIVSSTLENYVSEGKFEDNIFNQLVLFYWLDKQGAKTLIDGGERIVETLLYAKNTTAKSLDGYDIIDTTPQEGFTSAEFNWKMEAASIVFSLKEKLQNQGSKTKIFNLINGRIKQTELSIQDIMNTQAFGDGTGNNNKDLTGLAAIVNNTGVLGGIDRATNDWWRANVDSAAEAMSLAKMRNMYNTCSKGNVHPELLLTTQSLYEWYESQLQQNMRFTDNKLGDGGFENLKFKGATITYDDACQSGTMYFLNSKFLKLRVHSDADFKKTDFKEPTNQLAFVAQIYWMGNLTVNNCSMLGKLTNKTVA